MRYFKGPALASETRVEVHVSRVAWIPALILLEVLKLHTPPPGLPALGAGAPERRQNTALVERLPPPRFWPLARGRQAGGRKTSLNTCSLPKNRQGPPPGGGLGEGKG